LFLHDFNGTKASSLYVLLSVFTSIDSDTAWLCSLSSAELFCVKPMLLK
jgi:hypothetical protein